MAYTKPDFEERLKTIVDHFTLVSSGCAHEKFVWIFCLNVLSQCILSVSKIA